MRWWWSCFHADNTNLEILTLSQWHTHHELCVHRDNTRKRNNNEFCLIGCPHNSSNLRQDKHVLFKWKDRHFLLTWNRPRELETAFVHCVLVHAGNLKFRFQHGPFTKRFRPMVTRVPAVVLSISRFYRLAATRARIFALNKLTTEGAGTYSHFSPRPLRMSWLTYCCCIAVIACGIGLFRMARASSRLTSVQINTTKHFWVWGLAACLPRPAGRSQMLKMRICVDTHRRLKGIVIDCNRNLQQDTGYCTKKMSVHIFQVPRTLKSDVHLFAVLEKTSEEFDELTNITGPRTCLLHI